jgi:hypothetical protein
MSGRVSQKQNPDVLPKILGSQDPTDNDAGVRGTDEVTLGRFSNREMPLFSNTHS